MKQKTVLIILSILFSCSIFAQNQLKLENDKILAVFDPSNGSLVKLVNKETNWNIVGREQLGQSFEMLVPLEERRLHYINGKEQAAPTVQKTENSISFTWKALKSKHLTGSLNITFKGTVSLTKEGLVYSGEIQNQDKYTIEYLGWPFFGEVTVPNKQNRMICQGRNETKELFPRFSSDHGYWGVEYPTNLVVLPENSFLLIRDDSQGIYLCSEQSTPTDMLIASFELIPGFDLPGMNPTGNEMDGQMVRTQFKANHLIYAHPQSNTQLKPLKLELYKGNWQTGADRYKAWKQNLPTEYEPINWINQPITWQKVSISNGNDLINYAREAQKYGVSALSVNGWMRMGSNPYIELVNDFSSALNECKKLNIKVILEGNFTLTDFRSSWYKGVLKDLVMTDPFGWPFNRQILCPLDDRLHESLEQEYSKHPEILSADGMICNDNNHRDKSFFCFNPNHGHPVPAFADKGTFELDKHFSELVRQNGNNFATLGYGYYDTQTTFYNAYFINNAARDQSLHRYLNPTTPMIATTDVRTARQDMNLCLKNRYNICYDLQFYNNQLKTYPQIMSYGKQIEKLRNQYKEFIWDGTFNDVLGATVEGNNLSYAVYTRKSDGKKAVIVLNRSDQEKTTARISIENSNKALEMASPENPQATACDGTVTLQPQSAVVIVEK